MKFKLKYIRDCFRNKQAVLLFIVLIVNFKCVVGQSLHFYPKELETFPKTDDLVSGILSVHENKVNIVLKVLIYKDDNLVFDSTFSETNFIAGINEFSVKLNVNPATFITSDGYLFPGKYRVVVNFSDYKLSHDTFNLYTNNLIVPLFKIETRAVGDSILVVNRFPNSKDGQIYLKIREVSSIKKWNLTEKNIMVSDTFFGYKNFNLNIRSIKSLTAVWFCSGQVIGGKGENAIIDQHLNFKPKYGFLAKRKVNLGGYVTYEALYSSASSPYQIASTKYSRVIVEPNITINGIPFAFKMHLNTNSTPQYPNNFFKFDFNADKFKKEIQNSIVQEKSNLEQKMYNNLNEINDYSKSRNKLLIKLSNLNRTDSSLADRDTIGLAFLETKRRDLAEDIRKLEDKISFLNKLNYSDSIKLNKLQSDYIKRDSSNLLNRQFSGSHVANILSRINSFGIGAQAPVISEFLFAYRPLNGVFLDYKFRRSFVKVVFGKSIFNNSTSIAPSGYLGAFLVGFGKEDGPNNFFLGLSFNRTNENRNNMITSIGGLHKISNRLKMKTEFAMTFLDTNSTNYNKGYNFMMYTAAKADLIAKLSINSDLRCGVKYTGNSFQSLGVVNLTNDWISYNAQFQKRYLSGRLEQDILAERSVSNISLYKNNSSEVNSIGVNFRSRLNKLPDFNLSIKYLRNILLQFNDWERVGIANKFNSEFAMVYVGIIDQFKIKRKTLNLNIGFTNIQSSSFGNQYNQQALNIFIVAKLDLINTLSNRLTINKNSNISYYSFQNDFNLQSTILKGQLMLLNGISYAQTLNSNSKTSYFLTLGSNRRHINLNIKLGLSRLVGNWYETKENLAFFAGTTIVVNW